MVKTQVSRLAFMTASTTDSIWGAKAPAEGMAWARGEVKLALVAMVVWGGLPTSANTRISKGELSESWKVWQHSRVFSSNRVESGGRGKEEIRGDELFKRIRGRKGVDRLEILICKYVSHRRK